MPSFSNGNTFTWIDVSGNYSYATTGTVSGTVSIKSEPAIRSEPPMKIVELKHLPEEVANLIRMGNWTLYSYGDQYVVQTEAQNNCCNLHPQKTWLMDEDGLVIKALTQLPSGAKLAKLK